MLPHFRLLVVTLEGYQVALAAGECVMGRVCASVGKKFWVCVHCVIHTIGALLNYAWFNVLYGAASFVKLGPATGASGRHMCL